MKKEMIWGRIGAQTGLGENVNKRRVAVGSELETGHVISYLSLSDSLKLLFL